MEDLYCIMHGDKTAATLSASGKCDILAAQFLPYDLYLEETNEKAGSSPGTDTLNTLVNNMVNFYAWCSSRLITLDRKYYKEIMGSIGVPQAATDRDRAQIALSYHCLSLTDIFWVKKSSEQATFDEINLYDNHLSNAFVDISLRGKQMTATNSELSQDLSTIGMFPKAWVRRPDGFYLYKDGDSASVENELLASRIARCFDCLQVLYEPGLFEGTKISMSRIFTSKEYSICTWEAYQIHQMNRDKDPVSSMLELDSYDFYMMNIIDYLVGNTDRHWENWGFLIDNETNEPVSLYPLMDLNQAFHQYETLEGANCQTVLPKIMTQKDAALEAVHTIGLNQKTAVNPSWFDGRDKDYTMFQKRLDLLQQASDNCSS